MTETRGTAFKCAKYFLITLYILSVIGFLIYIIMGTLVVSAAHTVKDTDIEMTAEDRRLIKIFGYAMITGAIIGIPLCIIAIYGISKEKYKINFWMSVISAVGLILTLFSGTNITVFVLNALITGCQIWFTLQIKKTQDYSTDENNPELGKIKPDEKSAMVMNAYQE